MGGRCTECDRCDLYRGEDEDRAVRKAGERAEKEWREREGMVGVEGLGPEGDFGGKMRWVERIGDLGVQDVVDWAVDGLVAC